MRLVLFFLCFVCALKLFAQRPAEDPAMTQALLQAAKFLSGIDGPKDEKKALEIYKQCAEKGSGRAMNALGIIYREGLGVSSNRENAIEWFTKSGKTGYSSGWYNLGMLYKDGKTADDRDYSKAFSFFSKAADLNDPQSIYATAYFYYKGFGVDQNYRSAYRLFKQGAYAGRPNSMYFLALCYRNGYGVSQNVDSARYWLNRAWQKGYTMAGGELRAVEPENSNNSAKELARRLKLVTPSMPENVNQFKNLPNSIPGNNIIGKYIGYFIRYDWSGEHAIGGSKLSIEMNLLDGKLVGNWIEADTVVIPFQANLTPHCFVFSNTKSNRTDHYNTKPLEVNFENAKLQWFQRGDSVFLTGGIQMFSPTTNEPQKPVFIAVAKRIAPAITQQSSFNSQAVNFTSEDGGSLSFKTQVSAFPNPFTAYLNVDFGLKTAAVVEAQLLSADGKVVYKNKAGLLKAGRYTLPLKPPSVNPGTYILKLFYGNEVQSVKVIKL